MGTRGPGRGHETRTRGRSARLAGRLLVRRRRGRRRSGWLAALVGRVRRRWRSFWQWGVMRAMRDRYPGLIHPRGFLPGELRRFPQRTWR